MPRLKAALLSQQSQAAKLAAKKRAVEAERAKAASVKASSSGAKKGLKKAKRLSALTTSASGIATDGSDQKSGESSAVGSRPDVSGPSHQTRLVKATIPFDKLDTILLLGEANFSFAVSVFKHHNHPPQNLLATSYDSEEVCYEKYADAKRNVETLRRGGVRVEFGVDAGLLEAYDFLWTDRLTTPSTAFSHSESVGKAKGKGKNKARQGLWSRVIFNFPHVGAGITDQDRNIISNQTLLLRTLRSVQGLLTTGRSAFPIAEGGKPGRKRKHNEIGKEEAEQGEDEPEPDVDVTVSDVSDIEEDDADGDADVKAALSSLDPNAKPAPAEPLTARTMVPPKREGTLLVTLLDQPPYTLWDLRRLATKPPHTCPVLHTDLKALRRRGLPKGPPKEVTGRNDVPQPKYRLLRSFAFDPTAYPGYEHRRTIGFKEGVSKRGNEEIVGRKGGPRTWEFAKVSSKIFRS